MIHFNSNHVDNDDKKIGENSKELPFDIQWLNSSYQQTCLPDSSWQKIVDDLEPVLANRVRQQFNNSQRRQILIDLLGTQFQQKFFRSEPDTPYILLPPNMSEEHRHKLENEAKSWLQIQTLKAANEIAAAVKENEDNDQLSNDMNNFRQNTNEIVWKSLERNLYQIQQKEILKQEEQKTQDVNKIKHQNELTDGSKLRFILRDAQTNSRKLPMIHEVSSSPHSMASQYSDIISNSVIALLKQDLRRITFIKEKLFGQQLPIILRQISWTECLFRSEKKPLDHDLNFVELQTRRDFAAGITRGKNELKLTNPLNTPITNLIENDVIETYSKSRAFQSYLEEQHIRFTIKILNVLYTYKKDYETYFIYWLLPFRLIYSDEANKDEEIYVIAMHLDLFIRHCFPKWSNVFSIASKIMSDISIHDQEFYNHLKKVSKINTKINPKDFVVEIISLDAKQTDSTKQYENELMTDAVIFLRKWICEMFVGILNTNAMLYLWDQFFMIKWDILYIEYATKAIFYLLRDSFMCTTDYEEMRKVFLEEPYRLYTSDIQRAFVHLALKHDNPKSIPAMNQRIRSLKPLDNIEYLSNHQRIYAETIGIKNISLSFIIPVNKDPQQEFKYQSLVVEIQAYGNDEKLGSISTKSIPVIQGKEQLKSTWQKMIIDIPNEKLILSINQAHRSFIPTRIQALVVVYQRLDLDTLKTLGHCRFPLYIPQKIGNLHTWDMTFGLVQRALHSGIPPSSIAMIPDIPKTFTSDKIGPGSTISLVIFDPNAEQHLHHFALINLFLYHYRGYYQRMKRLLVICLPLLIFTTLIIYILYMLNIYNRMMNLLTINIMTNERHRSLLSMTLNHYKCCRIQEEILFDSVNERDYFIFFPYCQKVIEENELKKDQWNNITTCGRIFRSMVFYIRLFLILDLILNFITMIATFIYIWEETDEWIDDKQRIVTVTTDNINYKVK